MAARRLQARFASSESSASTAKARAEKPAGKRGAGKASGERPPPGASAVAPEEATAAGGEASRAFKEVCREAAEKERAVAGQATRAAASAVQSGELGASAARERQGETRLQQLAVLSKRALLAVARAPKVVVLGTARVLWLLLTEPRATMTRAWSAVRETAEHYWLGSKLLWADLQTAARLVRRVLSGHRLTRRERKQLLRTASDVARLVPFAFFVVVPFMELLLPLALKLFPSMLPSTFQSAYAKQETMLRRMRLRMELTSFMQETMFELARSVKNEDVSKELVDYLDAARRGEPIPGETLHKLASLFKDDITLDNVSRAQLVTMCQYMGLRPYGSDAFLRFQLRTKVRQLKNDDQLILWEGVEQLDLDELKQACQDRGMRSSGLTKSEYRRQLTQWLQLSVNREIPITLLILSRAFTMPSNPEDVQSALTASISAMEVEVINEAVLEADRTDSAETRRRRLESLRYQNELIADEEEEAKEAEARKLAQRIREREMREQAAPAATAAATAAAAAPPVAESGMPDAAVASAAPPGPAATDAAAEPAAAGPRAEEALRDPYAAPTEEEQAKLAAEVLDDGTRPAAGAAAAAATAAPAAEVPTMPPHKETWLEQRTKEIMHAMEAARAAQKLEQAQKDEVELTADQLDALTRLASESPVKRERVQLLRLQQLVEAEERRLTVASDGEEAAADRSTDLVKRRVAKMVASLEKELEAVDETIGGEMRLLDKDMDGVLSAGELQEAVKVVLAQHNTDEDAARIVSMIDTDGDGRVTVKELLRAALRSQYARRDE